ncbi:unnamed protein product [Rhizoctonia solani]|uniref:Cytochrome P450 n=1 Tax=Rhizoctonia solani TaxID=456999 RepID=A0A8H3AWH9_9AGAM|nr:unnamed protein product [Rhizoctonia solani]
MCPGVFHVDATLFITAASMLSMFDIRPEVDSEGIPIPLNAEVMMNEAVWQLHPFKCRITPRSGKHEQIIRDSVYI